MHKEKLPFDPQYIQNNYCEIREPQIDYMKQLTVNALEKINIKKFHWYSDKRIYSIKFEDFNGTMNDGFELVFEADKEKDIPQFQKVVKVRIRHTKKLTKDS